MRIISELSPLLSELKKMGIYYLYKNYHAHNALENALETGEDAFLFLDTFLRTIHMSTSILIQRAEELIKKLHHYGADITLSNNRGETPFYYAIKHNLIDVAHYLYTQNVDINAVDLQGNSALHVAVSKNNKLLVSELLSYNIFIANFLLMQPISRHQRQLLRDDNMKYVVHRMQSLQYQYGPKQHHPQSAVKNVLLL